ncbi:hypothetical protein V2J09_007754 [Rumex salicifolius]
MKESQLDFKHKKPLNLLEPEWRTSDGKAHLMQRKVEVAHHQNHRAHQAHRVHQADQVDQGRLVDHLREGEAQVHGVKNPASSNDLYTIGSLF